jgi:hypothetical protein
MKILIAFFATFLSLNLFSSTCCICQTGLQPTNEIHWFKKGCKLWLSKQKNCSTKSVEPIQENDLVSSALKCEGGAVKLGYVGHWGSSSQLIDYLSESLIPTAKAYKVDIDYDQTACTSMDNPKLIEDFFSELNIESKITVKGNQVTSTGMWDDVLPHKTNFWARINSRDQRIEFPLCTSFENKRCFGKYQKNETGFCINGEETLRLECTKISNIVYRWVKKSSR